MQVLLLHSEMARCMGWACGLASQPAEHALRGAQAAACLPYRACRSTASFSPPGRTLAYYLTNPITAGQGVNVVYETHACERCGWGGRPSPAAESLCTRVATSGRQPPSCRACSPPPLLRPCQPGSPTAADNPQSEFQSLFVVPSETLPIVIGEFGPFDGTMTLADAEALMQLTRTLGLPWTAWNLHMRCP